MSATTQLTTIIFLLFTAGLTAQPDRDQRFAAFGYTGLNLAQIDGDYYFGYNKAGIRFGVGAQLLLRPKWYLSVGLGFNQQGARPGRSEKYDRGGATIDLRLNSVEIPLLFHYRLGKRHQYTKREGHRLYRSAELQVGVALNRTVSQRIRRVGSGGLLPVKEDFVAVRDEFRQMDAFLMVGVTVPFSHNSGIFLQHGKSILGLYQPEEFMLEAVLPLYPYYLTLGYRHVLY